MNSIDMRSSLAIFFFTLITLTGFSQKTLVYDSSDVHVRLFNKAAIENYKADSTFQYDRILEPPASLWDRFWSWFWSKIAAMLSTETGKRTFTAVLILIVVAILVFTIMKLTGMSGASLFGGKNTGEGLSFTVSDEDIHGISFEEAIEKAVSEGNLRLAVRLLYLQTLKKLSDRGLISWQINKTNVAYVRELSGSNYQQSFGDLTRQFETNWYGDRHIEPSEYSQVQQAFHQFN